VLVAASDRFFHSFEYTIDDAGYQSPICGAQSAFSGISLGPGVRKSARRAVAHRVSSSDFCAGTITRIRQVAVRGLKKADQLLVLTVAAYHLTRMRTLGRIRRQRHERPTELDNQPQPRQLSGKSKAISKWGTPHRHLVRPGTRKHGRSRYFSSLLRLLRTLG
jgi:hypothetical protein